jgi:Flp pilus assembly protein TadB
MQTTIPHDDPETPGLGDMLGELVDLTGGLAVMLLPLMVTALPGVVLLLLLPAVLVAAAILIPVLVLVSPFLLARRLARRRVERRDSGIADATPLVNPR